MKLSFVVISGAIALASVSFGCHGHHSASAQHDGVGTHVAHSHGEASSAAKPDATHHSDSHHGEKHHPEMEHGSHAGHGGHTHGAMEVSSDLPIPAVELLVTEDAVGGWNVHTKLTNFKYAPEEVNESSLQTEGHAHLYVNGEKLTRLYGSWYHLSDLPSGSNELKVTLNANDHQDLTLDGKVISDVVTIEVP